MATTVTSSIFAREQKRRKNLVEEEDRIGQLPDDVLLVILCFLSFVEAARTCVLSKRWKYLWTHSKVLNFEFPKMLKALGSGPISPAVIRNSAEYVGWVNRVLQLHQGPFILALKINFFLGIDSFGPDIDEWFNFAIRKSVQRLEVNLGGSSHFSLFPSELYTIPDKFYSLIKSPYGLSCMKSLTQLSLTSVNVTGELVEHFLSYCPLLLHLRLSHSKSLVNLNVSGPSLCLKFLEISMCLSLKRIDIYAPCLASFICHGVHIRTRTMVRHAPSLVDLTLGHHRGVLTAFPAKSSCFFHLESLTLHITVCMDPCAPSRLPKLPKLKNLTLEGDAIEQHSLLDWTSLVERAPCLHTFTSKLRSRKRIQKREIWRPAKRLHECLKVLNFFRNIDFELATYFVQNAVALEKIMVDCHCVRFESWEELKEDECSIELRKHALELKKELPPEVELVICPSPSHL